MSAANTTIIHYSFFPFLTKACLRDILIDTGEIRLLRQKLFIERKQAMFKIAPIFSDHMVLQRGKNISVFGTGDEGSIVRAEFMGNTAETAVKDGKWLLTLPAVSGGEGLSMTVSCNDVSRTFSDIAMGEVWLAGGQSNMELELQNCKSGKDHIENDKDPNVRFYYTPKICIEEPSYEAVMENTGWSTFDNKESVKAWSAVGYLFAKELSGRLGCPVGVIGCNWGGTKASHWMSEQSLACDSEISYDLDAYKQACAGKTAEELTREYREYEAYNNEWNKKSAEYYTTAKEPSWDGCLEYCGECRYPGPPLPLNPMRATALYDSMLKKVCPYTLAGFLYYQGESDDPRPEPYYKLLRSLITLWRDDWGDDELPFMIVQLPMHMYSGDTDRKNWCPIRAAQEKAYRTLKNTGLAVIIDCGEFNEIHPKDKEPVAHRLFLQAMYNVYGDKNEEYNAPLYASHIAKDDGIEIRTTYKGGFELRGEKTGFELAGADGEFKKADFEIRGDRIFVFSVEISEPCHVRYLWTNYGDVTLYGKNGLPLAPFCK